MGVIWWGSRSLCDTWCKSAFSVSTGCVPRCLQEMSQDYADAGVVVNVAN